MLVGLTLLGLAGGATIYFWPQIEPLFEKKGSETASEDRKPSPPDDGDPKPTDDSRPVQGKDKDKDGSSASKDRPSDKTPPKTGDKPADKITPPLDPNKDRKPDPNKDRKPDPNKDKKPDPNKDKKPDPNKDKKPDPTKDKKPDPTKDKKPDDKSQPPRPYAGAYPRRALVVSVHNYLFANPLTVGDPTVSGRNIQNFIGRLSQTRGFRVSPNQAAYLSDAARPPRFQTQSPVKGAIENTMMEFLKTCRAQDRVLLMFVGHGIEIEDEAYLAPIETDLNRPTTLIPLKWVYKQMEECKAHQKVLVLDICRNNLTRGEERPSTGVMTPKFDLALKNPPAGIQVWASCTEGQQSYEFEDARINGSVFMDALYQVADKGLDVVQKPDDPYPIEKFVELVNAQMKKELDPLKLIQTSRLSGLIRPGGAPFDPTEKSAPDPVIIPGEKKNPADSQLVRGILKELTVPPVKKQQTEGLLRYEAMPPFPSEVLDKYPVDNTPTPLRDAIERAQAALWAISPNPAPAEMASAVTKFKEAAGLKGDLSSLKEGYRAAAGGGNAENQLKTQITDDQRKVASLLRVLEEELDIMKKAGEMKKEAPKRWQANYDFMLARLQAQVAYVYEYTSMLGAMRKEFPPRDAAVHSGWRLASKKKLQGDATGRKLATAAEKLLDTLIKDHPDTPWAVLAKREKFTALGLEWKPN